ncbi:MAG: hypothetical protein ACREGI_01605 [Candidatus Levyibacteriota bacterium]
MEKKVISVHAVTIHIYTILVGLLLLLVIVLGFKYLHLKLAVSDFTQATMWENAQQQPQSTVSDYATIIATTVSANAATNVTYLGSVDMQNYVAMLSKELKRDIVVMDTKQKILADTVVINKGTVYSYDKNHEAGQTLKDGVTRSFLETSNDYPQGVWETVVPMKNKSNEITGAVIVSNFQVSK